MSVISILVRDKEVDSIEKFISRFNIKLGEGFTAQDLANFEDNAINIENSNFFNEDGFTPPITLKVPASRVDREELMVMGNLKEDKPFEAFLSERVKEIVTNPGYKPLEVAGNVLAKVKPQQRVLIFSRSFGKVINLTSFVSALTTSNSTNGGNFNISLTPIMSFYDQIKEEWSYRVNNLFFNKSAISSRDGSVLNQSLFNMIVSSNDLIFIQFEYLENDELLNENEFFVSPQSLAGKQWDMIGLVDNIAETRKFEDTGVSVSIQGRDLMKPLIEDGCYFFPLDFASNTAGFLANTEGRGPFKRLLSGELLFFNAYVDRSVEFSLSFIFSQLSSSGFVPNEAFEFFEDKTTFFTDNEDSLEQSEAEGVWKIMKLVIDDEIKDRRIVDASITTDSGSLLNFVNKVCQDPFVEFYGDTFGDKFYFIARKPPFTLSSIRSYDDSGLIITIDHKSTYEFQASFDDSQVYSWYRLIPKGNFFGDSAGVSLLDFPAIYFDEYAQVWGSRPLQVVSNYINYQGIRSSGGQVSLELLRQQSLNDLAFVIDSNAYLPFTRKGSVVCRGDRRIRKGMWIRIAMTGEIAYVTSVTQSLMETMDSTSRFTVVNYERAMVEEHLDRYFQIIKADRNEAGEIVSNNFVLDKDIFEFFLKRQQYAK